MTSDKEVLYARINPSIKRELEKFVKYNDISQRQFLEEAIRLKLSSPSGNTLEKKIRELEERIDEIDQNQLDILQVRSLINDLKQEKG